MKRLITTLLAIFVVTSANAQKENILIEPKGKLPVNKDGKLKELVMNAGLFENGFIWSDLKGHSWWVHENPILRLCDTKLIQVNAYLYYNVREFALQEGWKVYYSLNEYLANPGTDKSHPPVFFQSE